MRNSFANIIPLQECFTSLFELGTRRAWYISIDDPAALQPGGNSRSLIVSDQLQLHIIGNLGPEIYLLLHFLETCYAYRDYVEFGHQTCKLKFSRAVSVCLSCDAAAKTLEPYENKLRWPTALRVTDLSIDLQ